AAGTLARLDPKHDALPAVLVEILKDDTHKRQYPGGMIRRAAMDALGRIGPAARPAVPALIETIDALHYDCMEAMQVLRKIGPEAKPAATALQKAVKRPALSHFPELQFAAAVALADVAPRDPGSQPAVAFLIGFVKDRTKRYLDRQVAVEALGRFGAAAV